MAVEDVGRDIEGNDTPVSQEQLDAYELAAYMNQLAAQFDTMVADIATDEQTALGPFKFLEEDVVEQMLNTLAWITVQSKQQAVKLMMLQAQLRGDPAVAGTLNEEGEAKLGAQGFVGVKDAFSSDTTH